MKKLLLSSIIMLSVCGIASAQTGSKLGKKQQAQATTTAVPAPTPQKSAIMPASDDVAAPAATDAQAATTITATPATVKTTNATTVNAAGVVVPSDDVKKREAKMAAVKAANTQKTGKQQK